MTNPKANITQEVLVGRDEFKIEIDKLSRDEFLSIKDALIFYRNVNNFNLKHPINNVINALFQAIESDPIFQSQFK